MAFAACCRVGDRLGLSRSVRSGRGAKRDECGSFENETGLKRMEKGGGWKGEEGRPKATCVAASSVSACGRCDGAAAWHALCLSAGPLVGLDCPTGWFGRWARALDLHTATLGYTCQGRSKSHGSSRPARADYVSSVN